eukprot:TRINITY_DN2068_c0_g1_i1.p1 TRINITY_DN2068_c0_g1~~TRINITY_DN2068_c0_g1_i1.p1  ORF type:complete len:114 (+),score=22.60 TRINITY_DN2068_c0_g1_i1:174-515(+)
MRAWRRLQAPFFSQRSTGRSTSLFTEPSWGMIWGRSIGTYKKKSGNAGMMIKKSRRHAAIPYLAADQEAKRARIDLDYERMIKISQIPAGPPGISPSFTQDTNVNTTTTTTNS